MGSKSLVIAFIILLASVFPAASGHDNFRQEMRFGAEAAQQGLWREAAFRWEKVLKLDPDNARVHNNLGVAYESLGRWDRALHEYQEARRLAPDNKEIRNNHQAFQEFCRQTKICGEEPEATPPPTDVEPQKPGPQAPEPQEGPRRDA